MNNIRTNEYKIVWQKWYDPFGGDDIEQYPVVTTSEDVEPEFYDDEGDIVESSEVQQPEFYVKPTRVIMTPLGIIPYTENTASNKIFNFWIGHCNFDLTPAISKIINTYPGIETLDIFTRYRFRIAIGKLFDAGDVMSSLNDKIYNFLMDS